MATDFEMAHRAPMFNYGSSSGFFTGYSNCRLQTTNATTVNPHHHHHQNRSYNSNNNNGNNGNGNNRGRYSCSPNRQQSTYAERKPGRPCLVNRAEDSNSSCSSGDETEVISPIRQKKKVVFADDRGLSLTQVRMMVDVPHSQSFNFNLPSLKTDIGVTAAALFPSLNYNGSRRSAAVNQKKNYNRRSINSNGNANTDAVAAITSTIDWKLTFTQPASNYLEFRQKLDEANVSLENIIIKDTATAIASSTVNGGTNGVGINRKEAIGTIKVKNLCYEKSVFVRTTTDNWATFNDVACSFVNNNNHQTPNSLPSIVVLYDTFTFSFPLLLADYERIEFCICYRTAVGEFWDNNTGTNYKLVKNQTNNAAMIVEPPPLAARRSLDFGIRLKSHYSWLEFNNNNNTTTTETNGTRNW